ncbi:MAG: hypothetical protein WBA87_03785 [Microbacterium sp.]
MKNRWKAVVVVGLFTFLLGGCSPTQQGARVELEQHAAALEAAAQDVLQALDAAGLAGGTAAGHVESCGGSLSPGVSYRAGGSAPVGDDLAADLEGVSQLLEATGWNSAGDLGGDSPSGRFTRDDITLDVKTGGFRVGDELHGADEMTFGLRIDDPCVRVPDGVHADEFQDLERNILPRD